MAGSNGRLPASALRGVGDGLFLETEAAEAFLAMRAHVSQRTGQALGLNAAYRTYAKQVYLYNGYRSGRPGFNLAAYPGQSNHGWGVAIDVRGADSVSAPGRRLIDLYGSPFGWAKRWSDAQSEPWHIKFNAAVWRQNRPKLVDPFAPLLPDERRWLREYIGLLSSGTAPGRRRTLWRVLKRRRQEIWKEAKKGGWNAHDRRRRYDLIRHYVGG